MRPASYGASRDSPGVRSGLRQPAIQLRLLVGQPSVNGRHSTIVKAPIEVCADLERLIPGGGRVDGLDLSESDVAEPTVERDLDGDASLQNMLSRS